MKLCCNGYQTSLPVATIVVNMLVGLKECRVYYLHWGRCKPDTFPLVNNCKSFSKFSHN
jgi:hypothetical protein